MVRVEQAETETAMRITLGAPPVARFFDPAPFQGGPASGTPGPPRPEPAAGTGRYRSLSVARLLDGGSRGAARAQASAPPGVLPSLSSSDHVTYTPGRTGHATCRLD